MIKKQCMYCGGSGKQACTRCNGSGSIPDFASIIGTFTACDECHGDGYVDCVECDGNGYVKSDNNLQPNDPVAEYELGNKYLIGKEIPRDFNLAYYWLKISAQHNNKDAQALLGWLYENKIDGRENLEQAEFWYTQAALQDNEKAQIALGILYYMKIKDYEKAYYWLAKVAIKNNPMGQLNLSFLYLDKDTKFYNIDTAIMWLLKVSENESDGSAAVLLGDIYYYEEYHHQNYEEALSWYLKASQQSNLDGYKGLGSLYSQNIGLETFDKSLIDILEKAAENDDDVAETILGKLYFFGNVIPQNLEKAVSYLTKAATQGNELALSTLHILFDDMIDKEGNPN